MSLIKGIEKVIEPFKYTTCNDPRAFLIANSIYKLIEEDEKFDIRKWCEEKVEAGLLEKLPGGKYLHSKENGYFTLEITHKQIVMHALGGSCIILIPKSLHLWESILSSLQITTLK